MPAAWAAAIGWTPERSNSIARSTCAAGMRRVIDTTPKRGAATQRGSILLADRHPARLAPRAPSGRRRPGLPLRTEALPRAGLVLVGAGGSTSGVEWSHDERRDAQAAVDGLPGPAGRGRGHRPRAGRGGAVHRT